MAVWREGATPELVEEKAFSAGKVEAAPSSSTRKTPLCYIVAQGD